MKVVYSAVYVAITGFIFYMIGEVLPRKWFSEDKFPYSDYKWEKKGKVYDSIKIKKWKNKVIDMSKIFASKIPKSVMLNVTPVQLQALIKETCVAEFIHYVLCLTSAGVCMFFEDEKWLIVWALCILGNIPFILIQRYNRPHLKSIRNRMLSKVIKKNIMYNI